jgi:tetrahydromethanopterin S-methyltransferase subunit C
MLLLGSLGAICLMIAGADELLDTGAGTLVWIGVLGLSVFAIARVVAEARSL